MSIEIQESIFEYHLVNPSYMFNDETLTGTANLPYFNRVADYAGTFAIHSLSHQSNKCYTVVDNIKYTIRNIPSARVSEGTRRIREGKVYFIWSASQADGLENLRGTGNLHVVSQKRFHL